MCTGRKVRNVCVKLLFERCESLKYEMFIKIRGGEGLVVETKRNE